MSRYPSLAPYESTAATAKLRSQLERVRGRMRDKAVLDQAVAKLATRENIRPCEAAERLAGMAQYSGLEPDEVARRVQAPPVPDLPLPDVGDWVKPMLETFHDSASYSCPVKDSFGRVVDFFVVAVNSHCKTPDGRIGEELKGQRLLTISPGVAASGLLDEYITAFETGVPFHRALMEHVEIMGERLWPSTMSVRAARVADGLLLSWCVLDDKDMLVSGWRRAQDAAGLGWGEWNLATRQAIWTHQMYEVFGRDPGAGPVALEDIPAMVLPEDLPVLDDVIDSLLEARESIETEFRIQHRYGVRHVSVVAEPLLDTVGVPVKLRFLVQDVTRVRRRERAEARAQERAVRQRERAEEEHRVADHLQNTILPVGRGVRRLPGLAVAVRYLPAEDLARLGGDWYKARAVPDGRALLVIGDAMGHGLTAAGIMLQMRAGLAGLAHTGAPAHQLALWLNTLLTSTNEGVTVTGTAIIGHFDAKDRTFAWTNAGHPNPLLVRDGRAELLEGSRGPLLGVFDAEYELTTTRLEPGDVLLFYTDGVVERRGADLDTGVRTLIQAVQACVAEDPDELIDCVLERLGGDHMEDDVCLLAARVL
ncbi:SpoIIE family protein phosphatase [Nonomuraea terrae]|uniref:SpoIIE family protein phosphatase n=1 Tax=Nonomuraea terrae TaxID=2530383 RepID=UPI00379F1710